MAIFCYHSIAPVGSGVRDWLVVDAAAFSRQMAFIKEHFACVPLARGVEDLLNGDLHVPTACVTFDDGYRNNLTVALPILTRLGIPATVFLATGFIGTGRSLWTTRLIDGLSRGPERTISLGSPDLLSVTAGTGRSDAARALVDQLKSWPAHRRRDAVDRLDAALEHHALPAAFDFMDWLEVRRLAASPLITLGAHTVNHELLSRVGDAELVAEIHGARHDIERHTGLTTTEFAYPNGRAQDFDRRSATVLGEAGFRVAVTTTPGLNDPSADPLMLRRVLVGGDDDLETFRLAAAGITDVRTFARALTGRA